MGHEPILAGFNDREAQLASLRKYAYIQDLGGPEAVTRAEEDLCTWAAIGAQLARQAQIAGDIRAMWAAVREARACLVALGLRRRACDVTRRGKRPAWRDALTQQMTAETPPQVTDAPADARPPVTEPAAESAPAITEPTGGAAPTATSDVDPTDGACTCHVGMAGRRLPCPQHAPPPSARRML